MRPADIRAPAVPSRCRVAARRPVTTIRVAFSQCVLPRVCPARLRRRAPPGDDGVAVVSYEKDQATCRSIRITAPVVRDPAGGRGISVVGGEDIIYVDVDVQGSRAGGGLHRM